MLTASKVARRPDESTNTAPDAPEAPDGLAVPEEQAKGPTRLELLTGDDLPSGRKAVVVPMRGRVERMLYEAVQSKDQGAIAEGLREVVRLCTQSLDGKAPTREDILGLHAEDERVILLRVRRRTYPSSPIIEFEWRCGPPAVPKGQACGSKNLSQVNLDEIVLRPLPACEPLHLPVSGKTATYDPPTGATAAEYMRLRKRSGTFDPTHLFLARKVKLDGVLATAAMLDDLLGEDRTLLKRALQREGGADTSVEAECPECGAEYRTKVEMLPGFFFPAEGG
jgi:hypothetical protein